MDLKMLKERLDKLQSKNNSGGGNKIDYSTIFWNPKVGKHQIRILPSKYNSDNPFTELKFYYGITNKVMISPSNFGEKDPIALFAAKLREDYSKENYALAKKIEAKVRIFVPVIIRGEEDKGVRLWQFGKQVYEELIALAVDDEIGDYTDVSSGRDITVETIGPESTGTPYNKSSVRVRLKSTPSSEDIEQVRLWLDNQPNPKELFKRYTFDEMKSALEKWLSPEDNKEEDIIFKSSTEIEDAPLPVSSKINSDISKIKKTKNDQFDALFDDNPTQEEEIDDLPFK